MTEGHNCPLFKKCHAFTILVELIKYISADKVLHSFSLFLARSLDHILMDSIALMHFLSFDIWSFLFLNVLFFCNLDVINFFIYIIYLYIILLIYLPFFILCFCDLMTILFGLIEGHKPDLVFKWVTRGSPR